MSSGRGRSLDVDARAETPERTGRSGRSRPGASPTVYGKPTVFVLDEPVRAELFELWLADGCRVETASSRSEIDDRFDPSVSVALVRNEARAALKEAVEAKIASEAPFCRTVVTTSEHVEIMFPGIEYDVCLPEPTTKASVRETVDRLARRAEYQRALREYYRRSVRAANIEVSQDDDDLLEDGEYAEVEAEGERLRERLETLLATFDADDLAAVKESVRPTADFGPESSERNKRRGEKHRPDKCVGCELEWGVDHGGAVGQGYRRLGAYVWKCTDCGTVQNLPDPSHRRLARR